MIKEGLKNVSSGANPVGVREGINKAVNVAVDSLKEISHSVKINLKSHK